MAKNQQQTPPPNPPDKAPPATPPDPARESIRQAIRRHEAHHAAWVDDPSRLDYDEAYLTSLWRVIDARLQATDASGLTPEEAESLHALADAYSHQLLMKKFDRRNQSNRLVIAWQTVLATW